MGKQGIFKVVTHIGGARHKRVQMCSQPGFWNFNEEWGTGITHTSWSCGGRVRGLREQREQYQRMGCENREVTVLSAT